MRNLKTSFAQAISIPKHLGPCVTAWDATDDSVIFVIGPTTSSPTIKLNRAYGQHTRPGEGVKLIASWDAPCPNPNLSSDEIVSIQHFSDVATTCLVLAGGDIVVVREYPQHGEETIEIVGSVDAGIAAATWAPDEELLAIVTNADTMVLMTRSFEPVIEVTLKSEDLGASKHVSVGWGKKETQFQGKRAKALRDPTMPERIDSGDLSPCEDGRTTISWRGDGAFLAVNRIVPDSRRVVRIFTREGTIDGASEPVDGLESALSWRPTGDLIAGVQRLAKQLDVVFFERNGLRHGEFPLRLSEHALMTWASGVFLSWSTDSTVLAVSFHDRVQLWTTNNYHYYLKKEILLDSGAQSVSQLMLWHPEKPLRMAVVKRGALILVIEYAFQVDRGSTVQPNDNGIVAVVDGKSLKLTPLRYAMVPPPMSFSEICAGGNIIDCAISPTGDRIALLLVASIEVFEWDSHSKPAQASRKIASLALATDFESPSIAPFRQIMMQSNESLFYVSPMIKGGTVMSTCTIDESSATVVETNSDVREQSGDISGLLHGVLTDKSYQHLWLQEQSGLCCLGQPNLSFSLATFSPTEIVLSEKTYQNGGQDEALDTDDRSSRDYHIISLSGKGELFANGRLLSRGCTSFVTTQFHLLFTTSQSLLKFVHLNAQDEYEVPADTTLADERCRSIERGGRIITVIPSIYAVVLQMPRGNLETIYPRALVLAGVRQHLDKKELKSAFLACQNHQVDINILYDHHPQLFIQHVPRFIEQVRKSSRIDLFLSKLSEDNVSETLYRDTLVQNGVAAIGRNQSTQPVDEIANRARIGHPKGDKINMICDAFLAALMPRLSEYLQNVITAHVCKHPPDLVSALRLIASLKGTDATKAEQAVAHLCFLSDVNRVYDSALSLYDLPLTLLVAQQAQRDPREYMPFLQSLNECSHFRRRFQIDDHLRNYGKALTSLHALASHEEVEAYTIKHALYPQALKLYRRDPKHLTSITRCYSSYLDSQSDHLGSAIASESLLDYLTASTSYAKCSPIRWREALHCASLAQPPLPAPQLHSLALQLATTVTEVERDHRSASQIYVGYLSDPVAAARVLCRGSYFAEALRLLSLHQLSDNIPETIDIGLAEKSGEITELMADCRSQLSAQVPRIKDLRVKKVEDPFAFFGGDPTTTEICNDGTTGDDMPDNVSLAPTNASTLGGQSLFTRYGNNSKPNQSTVFGGSMASSRKTSKTRRKEERKRARGKKGSVYEEEYLVNSVRRLVDRVNAVHGEVQRLIEGLARRAGGSDAAGNLERKDAVEESIETLVTECQRAVAEVWGIDENDDENDDHGYEVDGVRGKVGQNDGSQGGTVAPASRRPKGGDGVLWQSQMATQAVVANGSTPALSKDRPKVKVWNSDQSIGS